ncbi:hypothetical protein ACJX0J_032729, partial [Zea mays]
FFFSIPTSLILVVKNSIMYAISAYIYIYIMRLYIVLSKKMLSFRKKEKFRGWQQPGAQIRPLLCYIMLIFAEIMKREKKRGRIRERKEQE